MKRDEAISRLRQHEADLKRLGVERFRVDLGNLITMNNDCDLRETHWSEGEIHIWWISDTRAFQSDFPNWRRKYDLDATIKEIYWSTNERFK